MMEAEGAGSRTVLRKVAANLLLDKYSGKTFGGVGIEDTHLTGWTWCWKVSVARCSRQPSARSGLR